jgi:V/A-type H+-transporting ATPase subunit D
MAERLVPTRATLITSRRRLVQVRKGSTLLRRKREALVAELFRAARPAADARASIEERLRESYPRLLEVLAIHGGSGLTAMARPTRDVLVEVRPAQVWGIPVSEVTRVAPLRRTLDARGMAPALSGPTAMALADRMEGIVESLLASATVEQRIRRLGDAVGRSSRQLRTLERRVEPELEVKIALVRRALDEREREEHLRLKHVQRRLVERRTASSSHPERSEGSGSGGQEAVGIADRAG